jgi:hypothetical protein
MMDPITCTCWLVLTLGSQHVDNSGLNTSNLGVGVEIDGWGAGEYANSIHRTSVYAGKEISVQKDNLKIGFMAGAVTGYQRREEITSTQTVYQLTSSGMQGTTTTHYRYMGDSPGAISPMLAPFISIEGKNVGANLVLMPDPTYWKQSAIGLQFKFRM